MLNSAAALLLRDYLPPSIKKRHHQAIEAGPAPGPALIYLE